MDTTIVTTATASMDTLIGTSASIATTWITERTQTIRENVPRIREREMLYREFISEASRLAVDALGHSLDRPTEMVVLYGMLHRIRLVSGDEVLASAEECCRQTLARYWKPNLTSDQIPAGLQVHELDMLREFSAACCAELLTLSLNVLSSREQQS